MSVLPSPDVYQYISHLYHGGELVPLASYHPLPDWQYPKHDAARFQRMFATDPGYWRDQKVLDLGCHTGFLSLCALHNGARHVHGINVRPDTIDIANYAFRELSQRDYRFSVGDIEQREFLARACLDRDTVIMALVLEMIRNPYLVLETITASPVKRLVIESAVFSRDSTEPMLRYYRQPTQSAFSTWRQTQPVAMGAIPNTMWLESVLYELGWCIQHYKLSWQFSRNWFAQPDLQSLPPRTSDVAFIMATKFDTPIQDQVF
jgi:SAM-dependent methyltransferase